MKSAENHAVRWLGRLGPLALICAAHTAVLWWLTDAMARNPVLITPPAMVGVLVSAPPVTAPPQPLPMAPEPVSESKSEPVPESKPEPVPEPKPEPKPTLKPEPKPKPKPIAQPKPKPPRPAPPSKKAVTVPEPEPESSSPPRAAKAAAPLAGLEQPAAASSAPSRQEPLQPVLPPRSDASHLNNPAPAYPALSRRLGEQGRVLFNVYILANGAVGEINLRRSSGYPRLDEAALAAVQRWRYLPARRGTEPIPFWYVQPIIFELNQ